MQLGKPRRLDFATVRELFALFAQNELRATFAALGLLYPSAVGLTAAAVDARYRTLGNVFALGGWLYEVAHERGIGEAEIAEQAEGIWGVLLGDTFPTDDEVREELGNSLPTEAQT